MLIKSKFSDYYDGGAAYGVDTERFYIREKVIFENPKLLSEIRLSREFEVIGFCGNIYPLINHTSRNFGSDWIRHPKDFTLYGDECVEYTFIEDTKSNKLVKILRTEEAKLRKFSKYYKPINRPQEQYNTLVNSKVLKNIFLEYRVPIFHIGYESGRELTLNPCLSDFGFYKVKNTVEAFQEIEMYLNNVLTNTEDAKQPVGSDLDLLKSKGFDPKLSFRKDKKE
jgi:hypothetical protein